MFSQEFPQKGSRPASPELAEGLEPIVETIASLTGQINTYNRRIEELATKRYPQVDLLRQVQGVGTLTALTFVLTLEDPRRFGKSRTVGAYLGLVPGTNQSGERDLQNRIAREGNEMLRSILVTGAHYIMGPLAKTSRAGLKGE
jgi:transposase